MYYNGYNTLSYNALFNFIIGNRGGGKTYWFKEWAIKDFIKNGNQFVYLRRFDTEFDEGKKDKFFDDIMSKFPNHEFKVKGYTAYIDNKVCGSFMPLTKAKTQKSVPMPKVNKICFDEFLLDPKGYHHYLPDEVTAFLEFYETVSRLRVEFDEKGNWQEVNPVRVFFLSNATTITNPYFLFWDIRINPDSKKIMRVKDDMVVELVMNEEFINIKKQTRFGKIIDGTKYGDYNMKNTFLRDDKTFIGKKTGKAKHYFTLVYHGKSYGVWIDYSIGKYFVSEDLDPFCKMIYTITQADHTVNTMLVKGRRSRILTLFTESYQRGEVIFENINIKNVVYEIIRLFLM